MKKSICLCLMCIVSIILIVSLISCSNQKDKLIGTWEGVRDKTLSLDSNSEMLNNMNKLQKNIVQKMISNIKFQFKKNEFMLKMGDKTEKHKYEIKSSNDNDLNVILDNDDKIKVKFKNKNEAIFKGASDKLNFYMRKTN